MNKPLIIILLVLGVILIAYNVMLVDFENPLEGNSTIALIGIVASLCAIVLILLYVASKKVQKKIEED